MSFTAFGLVLLWRHENRRFLLLPDRFSLIWSPSHFPLFGTTGLAGNTVFTPYDAWCLVPIKERSRARHRRLRHAVCQVPVSNDLVSVADKRDRPLLPGVATCFIRRPAPECSADCTASRIGQFLPYWLAPASGTRYLMPLYPLFALLMAYIVLNSGKFIIDFSQKH